MEKVTLLWGGPERLRTGRGKAASTLAVAFAILAVAGSSNGASTAGTLILLSPLIWWVSWGLAGVLVTVRDGLVEGHPPELSVGRAWQSSSTRKQLRQDGNARVFVDRGGILLRERYWFVASGTPVFRLSKEQYDYAVAHQEDDPVLVASHRDRQFWWYDDEFYWTNNWEYDSEDIKALLFMRERQRQRELDHAHAVMAAADSPAIRKREPIPRDVKQAVFKRDEGKCVECGSGFEIQYDHIIPLVMGGANTVENLQLLCARCNQQKGGRL